MVVSRAEPVNSTSTLMSTSPEAFDALSNINTAMFLSTLGPPKPALVAKYRQKYEQSSNVRLVRMFYSQHAIFAWCIPNPENKNLSVVFSKEEEEKMEASLVQMLEKGGDEKIFTELKDKLNLWARKAGQAGRDKEVYCFASTPDHEEITVLGELLLERFHTKNKKTTGT